MADIDLERATRCEPGTRQVEVVRWVGQDRAVRSLDEIGPAFTIDCVQLKPYAKGSEIVFVGYHELTDQWFVADE